MRFTGLSAQALYSAINGSLNLDLRGTQLCLSLLEYMTKDSAFYTLRAGILPQYAVFWLAVVLHKRAMQL